MTAGRFFLVASISLATAGLAVPALLAQSVVPAVENAKFGAAGAINAASVLVRSGPGENYYATQRLEKGAPVTVVGVKFDWLKILPPDGSFSYVAKQFVEKTGENTGRVTRPDVNVRAGSSLNPMTQAIQTKLQQGDAVEIVGEYAEYYKIKPPVDAFVYVNKQFVDATKMLGPTSDIVKTPAQQAPAVSVGGNSVGAATVGANDVAVTAPQAADDTQVVSAATPGTTGTAVVGRATDAAEQQDVVVARGPATRPSTEIGAAITAYQKAESEFRAASDLSIDQQPVAQLAEAYQSLAANDKLPASMRTIAKARLETLKVRGEAQQGYLAVRKAQDEAAARRAALETERQQLEAKLNQNPVLVYTAMGALKTSSLKLGDTPVYRLVDPANGRTLVYIRGNDPALASRLEQFVGVKGDVVTDPQLSLDIITPTDVETVDPSKVNATAARIQPTSLRTQASTTDK